jgi:S1-C subfamily serine protease
VRLGIDGVAVVNTSPGSPAECTGLQGIDPRTGSLGDIIVAANGKPVHLLGIVSTQHSVEEVASAERQQKTPGDLDA